MGDSCRPLSRARTVFWASDLGLAPQALCCRPLSRARVGNFVFGVPLRGSLVLLYGSGMLCVLSGIGIGTIIATFTRSQQQAQLMSFFVNPPLSMLSGSTTPIEAMPQWMQPLTNLNPVKHFAVLARGVMLKGVGLEVLYPNFLALVAFTTILVGVSVWRFRKQLN